MCEVFKKEKKTTDSMANRVSIPSNKVIVQHNFQPKQYVGLWYQYASIPQPWEPFYAGGEKTCSYATAYYKAAGPTGLSLVNTCFNSASEPTGMIGGTGREKYPGQHLGWYLIKFDQMPFEADYIVHDTDYVRYAVVGSLNKNMLWILVRKDANLTDAEYAKIIEYVTHIGYDASRLNVTPPM